MTKPINVLTGLDYWLDNLMCNVPEMAMCYHLNGIVQVWFKFTSLLVLLLLTKCNFVLKARQYTIHNPIELFLSKGHVAAQIIETEIVFKKR